MDKVKMPNRLCVDCGVEIVGDLVKASRVMLGAYEPSIQECPECGGELVEKSEDQE